MSKPSAVVLDVDGTLRDWDLSVINKGLAFADKHHKLGHVLVIASSGEEESTRAWLAANFPYPFLGPYCRPPHDGRHTSVFKMHVAQDLEKMGYQIVGAADDNVHAIRMWQLWAAQSDPGFDILRTTFSRRR